MRLQKLQQSQVSLRRPQSLLSRSRAHSIIPCTSQWTVKRLTDSPRPYTFSRGEIVVKLSSLRFVDSHVDIGLTLHVHSDRAVLNDHIDLVIKAHGTLEFTKVFPHTQAEPFTRYALLKSNNRNAPAFTAAGVDLRRTPLALGECEYEYDYWWNEASSQLWKVHGIMASAIYERKGDSRAIFALRAGPDKRVQRTTALLLRATLRDPGSFKLQIKHKNQMQRGPIHTYRIEDQIDDPRGDLSRALRGMTP